jgi:hypothetical protein
MNTSSSNVNIAAANNGPSIRHENASSTSQSDAHEIPISNMTSVCFRVIICAVFIEQDITEQQREPDPTAQPTNCKTMNEWFLGLNGFYYYSF